MSQSRLGRFVCQSFVSLTLDVRQKTKMEALLIIPAVVLLYGGGLVIALIALIIATFRNSRTARVWFSVVACLALVAQGGCWKIASDIGSATGGSGGGSVAALMTFAGAIALVWSIVLIASAGSPGPDEPIEERKNDEPI